MKSKSNVALFDVCGTTTKTNNTFDFIGFALRENKLKSFLFKIINLIAFFIYNLRIQLFHFKSPKGSHSLVQGPRSKIGRPSDSENEL